jgi:hypothetical protein
MPTTGRVALNLLNSKLVILSFDRVSSMPSRFNDRGFSVWLIRIHVDLALTTPCS